MSPEAQRIAIAEYCGWKWVSPIAEPNKRKGGLFDPSGRAVLLSWNPEASMYSPDVIPKLPDYLNDLNASHEMEKVLGEYRKKEYWQTLCEICNFVDDNMIYATAAQRAEAFLKAIGKWEEGT